MLMDGRTRRRSEEKGVLLKVGRESKLLAARRRARAHPRTLLEF